MHRCKQIIKLLLVALIAFTAFFNFGNDTTVLANEPVEETTTDSETVKTNENNNEAEITTTVENGMIIVDEDNTDTTEKSQIITSQSEDMTKETRAGPITRAGTVVASKGSTGYSHTGTASGNGHTAWFSDQEILMLTGDGTLGWCVEPWEVVSNPAGTSGYTPTATVRATLDQYILHGYYLRGKSNFNYAVVQLLIWESYGYYPSSHTVPNYANEKASILASIAQHNTKPSFDSQTITVRVGTPVTITDVNGVLGSYSIAVNNTGVTAIKSGDTLTLTATADDVDGMIGFNRYTNTGMPNSSLLWTNPTEQDVYSGGNTDPVPSRLNIKVEKFGSLEISKKDNLGNYVPGVTFDVFYETGENAGTKIGTYTTGTDGKVKIDEILPYQLKIVEKAVVAPLVLDSTPAYVTIIPNETVSYTKTNQRVTGTAILKKVDKDTGGTTPQGEARLDDAVYELRALEDTYDAITGAKILSKDQLIKTETIGSDLTMTVSGLQPARYYFVEKTEATGYLIDNEKHIVDLRYVDSATAVVTKNTTSYQEVKRGNIKLQKFINTEGTGIKLPEPGAVFIVQLEKDVKAMGDSAPVYATITTDLLGQGEAKDLPWAGVEGYRVTQTTAMNENLDIAQPFNSKIINDGETMYYIIGNELHTSYIQVLKYDADLGEAIVFPATFKIYDVSNDEWYSEVIGNKLIEKWTTDETGMLITNKVLPAGDYELVETGIPTNYLQPDENIPFTIKASNVHETNIDGKPIYVIRVSNQAPKGSLTLNKVFERVDGLHDDEVLESGWKVTFVNDVIANYNGETILFNAGEQLVNPNSADGLFYANEDAELLIENIYVGAGEGTTIKFDEEVYPEGYVQADSFTETWKKDETDNTTKVIEISRKVENKVIRTDIEVVKTDLYSNEVVKGIFGFEITAYLDEELTEVYDTQFVNPFTGKAVFKDVAYGTTLYFKETATHESYYLSDEVIKVIVDKTLENIGEVYSFTYANRPVPTIGTTATGINDAKVLDPTVSNELMDISDVKNIDTELIYTIHTRYWLYDESGNGNHTVVLEEIYRNVTFEEADTLFTSKLLAEANTLEEGRYYFTEEFYTQEEEETIVDVEKETPLISHNDPEDTGQTLHMEKFAYSIYANKTDSSTGENIKNSKFKFQFDCYKDGELISTEEVKGSAETGIATFNFNGSGIYDEIHIKEIEEPDGYLISEEVKVVKMEDFNEERVYSFTYNNDRLPAKVVVKPSVKAGDATNVSLLIGLLTMSGFAFVVVKKKRRYSKN